VQGLARRDPATIGAVVDAIREASAAEGRPIAGDHYGATVPFRIGSRDDAAVARVLPPRAGASAPPSAMFAVGRATEVVEHCRLLRRAGVHKFVMIPLVRGDADLFDQSERLVCEVLPAVHALD